MAKWTCKIVDFPQNCTMEMVTTCSTTDSNGSCHGPAPSFFEEMTRCCHQKHHQQWPGNRNGRSKIRNIRLFTFTRPQLTLRGWRRLTEVAQMARSWRKKHHQCRPGNDQDRSKFRNYENLCLRDQAKPLEKHLFAVRPLPLWWHCALFNPYYHWQQVLFSPTSTEKPRYTYWRVFLYILFIAKP